MRCRWLVPLVGGLAIIAGCGTPAAPSPPSLNLPEPVLNLSASRVGNSVQLAWTTPTRTTDKVMLRHAVTAEVCRAEGDGGCAAIGRIDVEPGKAGAYTDVLPASLIAGPDRLIHYEVVLRNHAGKAAGASNPAYSAAGVSPAPLVGLSGQMRREGVELSWQPVPDPGRAIMYRIQRIRLGTAEREQPSKSPLAPALPPASETLLVRSSDGHDPGHAVDASAASNQQYRYAVERVAAPSCQGQSIEIRGLPSEPILVATKDVFPPGVPAGLAAIADTAGPAIDLSWNPDSANDLSSYSVYRRDVQGGATAQRIASTGLDTSFRDTTVHAGGTYAYSLSATDQSGNESQRCSEVEETVPSR